MNKILSWIIIGLLCLSMFLVSGPQVKADPDIQLTTNPLSDTEPSWSPDGAKIVYHAYAGSWYRHIWVMNSDGSNKNQLTGGNVVDAGPAYSPDGTKIAFSRWGFRGDYMDLMIMDADGSNVQRITFSGIPGKRQGSFEGVGWSEDGTKLVFYYNEGTTAPPYFGWWIGTVNVDGTDLEVLGRGMEPQFTYGDTKILFSTDYFYEDGRCIALMNADGTGMRNLTSGPYDMLPHMSSTTNRIVFTRYTDLYVMDEDGSNLEPITSDGTNSYAEWSPDEQYITYASVKSGNGDIWKMEAPFPTITATIDIDPDTLNVKSNGQWITCYIELPEGYDVSDIDVNSILLNDTIPVDVEAPITVGDYDLDNIPDLVVKFDRATMIQWLNTNDYGEDTGKYYEVNLTITGTVAGTQFSGTDRVKVLKK